MKQTKFAGDRNQKPAVGPSPTVAAPLSQSEIDFIPSPDEVARRAYFSYENQGSLPGHEVQHWLTAEAALIAERQLTRTHTFQHHSSKNSTSNHVEKINP